MARALQNSCLHKEATEDTLSDVDVVVWVSRWLGNQTATLLYQYLGELVSNVASLLKRSKVKVIFPAPVWVLVHLLKRLESL